MVSKRAKKVTVHLGYFWKNICRQELSKIVQSGHTAHTSHTRPCLHHISHSLFLSHSHTLFPFIFFLSSPSPPTFADQASKYLMAILSLNFLGCSGGRCFMSKIIITDTITFFNKKRISKRNPIRFQPYLLPSYLPTYLPTYLLTYFKLKTCCSIINTLQSR